MNVFWFPVRDFVAEHLHYSSKICIESKICRE